MEDEPNMEIKVKEGRKEERPSPRLGKAREVVQQHQQWLESGVRIPRAHREAKLSHGCETVLFFFFFCKLASSKYFSHIKSCLLCHNPSAL